MRPLYHAAAEIPRSSADAYLQSTPFPVDLLAALVSRRKATPEEVVKWTSQADED
jgi:hypothetical protein